MQFLTQKELIEAISYADDAISGDVTNKQDKLTISDENLPVAAAGAITTINFTGSGVQATASGSQVNVSVNPSAARYFFVQTVPSALWTINHNLGFEADVEVRSSGGVVVWADIIHINVNQVQVTFAAPFAGTATVG